MNDASNFKSLTIALLIAPILEGCSFFQTNQAGEANNGPEQSLANTKPTLKTFKNIRKIYRFDPNNPASIATELDFDFKRNVYQPSENAKRHRVVASMLNLRSAPNTGSKVVGLLKSGAYVRIQETLGGWGKTDDGWVFLKYLEKVP